ncbi:hypothetical protein KKH42_02900 [bacterium]|nr:hypothetical protein [bacterium]MBU4134253.1 hypothetical protein [bacterium]
MTSACENNTMQDKLIKKMPGWQRLKIAFGLNDFARKIIRADIKKNNPHISDKEADKLVAERFRK